MRIIIAGAGEVGVHLAKLLSYESLDITLIDIDREALAYANTHLDIRVVKGDATSIAVLEHSDVKETDLVIAVTESETVNITACVLAKQLGAKRTIARISNTEFIEAKNKLGFRRFGIDELISPEMLASSEIEQLLDQNAFNDTFEFEDGALTMIGLTLPPKAAFIGKTVREVAEKFPGLKYVPVAMKRKGSQKTIIPRGNTEFKTGDQVYFTTIKNGIDTIVNLTGSETEVIRNVMILGGGRIGYRTAKSLCEKNYHVKLIENNKERALELAEELPECLVIYSDGRNVDLLQEEAIDEMDAFIAVTGNSEVNIISSLVAKSKGVKKTIALVENIDYFQLSYSIGVDTLINKKLLAANMIFRFVRKGLIAMTNLSNMNAELFEFKVNPGSRACNKKIRNLDFPASAIIGGVIRDGEGIIALGEFQIQAGDHLVICCLPQAIGKVEKLFK